jgi:hypothetical protein
MKILGFSLPKKSLLWVGVAIVVFAALVVSNGGAQTVAACPGSQVYCAGVGCVSGMDKCVPGAVGGPSKVFSKETFTGQCKAMKPCPGGTRTDGPCLMDFA